VDIQVHQGEGKFGGAISIVGHNPLLRDGAYALANY
jgi:hypothetical protein